MLAGSFFPIFLFRMECLLRTDRTDTAYSHLKTCTRDLNWTHPSCTPPFPLTSLFFQTHRSSLLCGPPFLRPVLESTDGHFFWNKPAQLHIQEICFWQMRAAYFSPKPWSFSKPNHMYILCLNLVKFHSYEGLACDIRMMQTKMWSNPHLSSR